MSIRIPPAEFKTRVEKLRQLMTQAGIDVCLVYGDEYRRENLRYISNYWPIFERGAAIISLNGDPIILAAPEGEKVCGEMSVWRDIRVIPDFACVTVPDEIEYPQANYTDFSSIFSEIKSFCDFKKLGIVGKDAMSVDVYNAIVKSVAETDIVDANSLLYRLRLIKSEQEIQCLKHAARIADIGYMALMREAEAGKSEQDLEAAACHAVIKAGAEYVPFCLVSSGERVQTIIGRATNRVIKDGDMILAALAVQYEGYIATVNFPFTIKTTSEAQKALIDILVEGDEIALSYLKSGAAQKDLVAGVKKFFTEKNVSKYDLYPPLHGCGVAEAESPYPNEKSDGYFQAGMTVNIDLSLFGHPDGSNRIEEGFVITHHGCEPMSKLVRNLIKQWKEKRKTVINDL